MASTSTASSTAGVREFATMAKGKKRSRSIANTEESQGMKMLRDLITAEKTTYEATEAENTRAREQALSDRETMLNLAADLREVIAHIRSNYCCYFRNFKSNFSSLRIFLIEVKDE